jgi:2-polyprenyl-3-methyl-5-hydroxy-6-metoxy-1,4-benzoquinol methylase
MTCSQCLGLERRFGRNFAQRKLREYIRHGPSGTTRKLLDAIKGLGVTDRTFLDIGGGVGAIQHELMAAGASGGTGADASPAYVETARAEAERRGYADRIVYREGDFVAMGDQIEPADIVTLDRVVCCYPDMPALVDASASRARRIYGLVYPRERALVKVVIALMNFLHWIGRHPFRAFVHPTADVEARVASHGLEKSMHTQGLVWQIVVFTRPARD